MSKPSYFKPISVNASKHRKTKNISRFLGVDYTSQKFNVADGRAIDLLNYIYKDGVVQKRNGYEEIFKVKPTQYYVYDFDGVAGNTLKTNDINFNSLYSFLAEDNQVHLVAHIGKLLYEITDIEDERYMRIEPIKVMTSGQYPVCYEFLNYKSSAFVGGRKLWFLGGNKYMILRFTSQDNPILEPVENSEFASIPTTTISRTYVDAIVNGAMSYDKVNLLQRFRKNKFISGVGKVDDPKIITSNYEYELDSPLICKNENLDMANFSMVIYERGKTG